jgi:hypothetical protein
VSTISLFGCSLFKNTEQKSSELKDFKIIVEKIDDEIKMQSTKNSDWVN